MHTNGYDSSLSHTWHKFPFSFNSLALGVKYSTLTVFTCQSCICCQRCPEMSLKILLIFNMIKKKKKYSKMLKCFYGNKYNTGLQHSKEGFGKIHSSVKAVLSNMFGLWPPLKIMHIYWRSLVTCCICRSALTISTSSKMKYVFSCLFSDTTMTKLLFGRTFLHVFIEVLPLTLRILIAFMQTGKGQSLTVLKSYSWKFLMYKETL